MRSPVIIVAIGLLALAQAAPAATITVRRDGTGDFTTFRLAIDAPIYRE